MSSRINLFLLLVAVISVTPIAAFFPYPYRTLWGVKGVDHQTITENALKVIYADLGIDKPSASMDKAREEILTGNADTDHLEEHNAEAHFDGERFEEGQKRIMDRYKEMNDDIKNSLMHSARTLAGQQLHGIQDFYSHSNYIDDGYRSPHHGLVGEPDESYLFTNPDKTTPACKKCSVAGDGSCYATCVATLSINTVLFLGCVALCSCPDCTDAIIAPGLTSGYYFGEMNDRPAGKCSHGGWTDAEKWWEPEIWGINKDSLFCSWSPNGQTYHMDAVGVATDSSVVWFRALRTKVGDDKFKQFLGLGPALGFAIDTTGSMGSVISSVQAAAVAIVDERLGTEDEPSSYVLAPFNDPDFGPVQTFTDADEFKSAINALYASGGGDCPEMAMNGMLIGIDALSSGASLFMYTDAEAKDYSLMDDVISSAFDKDIKVITMMFGTCAEDGFTKRDTTTTLPRYEQIARATGGQYFTPFRSEAGTVTRLADSISRSNSVDLLNVKGTLASPSTALTRRATAGWDVLIDSETTEVTFSLSADFTVITITRPDGTTVNDGDSGVTFVTISQGQFVTIMAPVTGKWHVSLSGNSLYSLQVTGISTLHFTRFTFLMYSDNVHHGFAGWIPTTVTPAAGDFTTANTRLDGGWKTATFDIRGEDGDVFQTLDLEHGSGEDGDMGVNDFIGNFTLPSCPFLVYVTGTDLTGAPFQRLISSLITPPGAKEFCGSLGGGSTTTTSSTTTTTTTTTSSTTPSFTTTRFFNTTTTSHETTTSVSSSSHTTSKRNPTSSHGSIYSSIKTYSQGSGYATTCTEKYSATTSVYSHPSYGPPLGGPSYTTKYDYHLWTRPPCATESYNAQAPSSPPEYGQSSAVYSYEPGYSTVESVPEYTSPVPVPYTPETPVTYATEAVYTPPAEETTPVYVQPVTYGETPTYSPPYAAPSGEASPTLTPPVYEGAAASVFGGLRLPCVVLAAVAGIIFLL
ncbi:hypothetical protein H072_1638 [Dactylellina haptotyla CBS 200.50]|uniref:VWFA domain-containing protein n=1 Tax=Dactylellina haptotyla (strain CBS 200.50) TaxID=1284197 RepID=S8ATT4_DACHA|nr:hypothetical protein H072_1638 [Dactylellina haptotyla CBS 200.50]